MRWRVRKRVDQTEWHSWFAWHPVKIGGVRVWLERVCRQIEYDREGWTWHYDWLPGDSPNDRKARENDDRFFAPYQ